MCHLQTHVVIDAGDEEIYMAAYNANQDMDYNDFSVQAYVNPAASHGPKPGARKGRRNDSSEDEEDDVEADAGTPAESQSVSPGLASPVIDWMGVSLPSDSRRDQPRGRAISTSEGRGAGRGAARGAGRGAASWN